MPLWGATDADESKPKHLTTAQKKEVYAAAGGWTVEAGSTMTGNGNTSATPEVLVAIGDLAGSSSTTGLRAPTVTSMRFVKGSTAATDLTAGSSSQTVQIEVTWDEAVTVAGSPVMKVVNSGGGTHDCVYTATGSTANRKRFTVASQTLATGNVLSLGTALHDTVTLPGGATIKDTASGTINSQRTIPASLRVTHTVTA